MTYLQRIAAYLHLIAAHLVYESRIDQIAAVAPQKAAALQLLFHLAERAARFYFLVDELILELVPHDLHINELIHGQSAKTAVDGHEHAFDLAGARHVDGFFDLERKVGVAYRLDDEIERVHLVPFLRILRHFGHEHEYRAVVLHAQVSRRVQAAHAGQVDVHEHDGKTRLLARLQKVLCIAKMRHVERERIFGAVALHEFYENLSFLIIVLDQRNLHRSASDTLFHLTLYHKQRYISIAF